MLKINILDNRRFCISEYLTKFESKCLKGCFFGSKIICSNIRIQAH